MTMSWDMKSMDIDFWQCKHEFNIIMSKKQRQDNWWCCMSLFRWFLWREASPCPPPLKTYLDLWTIVSTIKKPKSMNMTICTWAFIMRTLPYLVLDMLIVLAYSIPVSRGTLRWHGLWTMEPLPLHLPQIFICILTNCRVDSGMGGWERCSKLHRDVHRDVQTQKLIVKGATGGTSVYRYATSECM